MSKSTLSNRARDEVKRLRRRDYRLKTGRTIAEGYPEVTRAIAAGIAVDLLYICPEIIQPRNGEFDNQPIVEITKKEFATIAFGEQSKGILAICRFQTYQLADLKLKAEPFLVIIDSIEKPGNLGTIIRCADGSGADGVIMCDARTDVYNHNIVRASLGAVFSLKTVAATKEETLDFCRKKGIAVFATTSKAEKNYYDCPLAKASAIVVGSEHEGLSDFWLENAGQKIKIPMQGVSTSLNAAMSASIIMYEAFRQRQVAH